MWRFIRQLPLKKEAIMPTQFGSIGPIGSYQINIPQANVPTTSHHSGPPTVRKGSQGLQVAYCQNLLNARMPFPAVLWVDGIFGQKTDQRVRQFQTTRRLTVDGIVGPQTLAALEMGPPPIRKRPV
jgi:peptidoglycan hydrolase-like protein with peptidoglycan-binding domain